MTSKRIAVYGGSFNPFGGHHQDIVRWLAEEGGYDIVIVVPSAAHALKSNLPDFVHRYNITKLGVNDLIFNGRPSLPQTVQVNVSMIEMNMLLQQPAPVRTYELLKEFRKAYNSNDVIHFAIGPDIPGEMDRWANVPEIKEEFGFVHLPIQSMRATKLREMIAMGVTSWHRHVPLMVRRYIEMHGLYHVARTTCEHEWESTGVQSFQHPHTKRCGKCGLPKPGSECESWHKAKAHEKAQASS